MDVCSTIKKYNSVMWLQKWPPRAWCCSKLCNAPGWEQLLNTSSRILLTLVLALSTVDTSQASESKVLFIKSGSAQVYNRIIDRAKSHINKTCSNKNASCIKPIVRVESIQSNRKLRNIVLNKKWDLIVAVGTKAATKLNSFKSKLPVIYSLIPSHSYPAIKSASTSNNKSAIYIDQPIRRQLQLIKSALPEKKRVGVILGKHSGISKGRLQKIMRNMGLQPIVIKTNASDIRASLKKVYSKVDALLAQPDPSVYNRSTVMTVLLTGYRHNVPVFGYSAAFVRSGAAAAIYSSPNNIGQQIGEEIISFISSDHRKLSPAGFPKYYSVDTNRRVINSLKIAVPSTNKIKARVIQAR
jgi:ABC-type uncharacterized transport system substrate-binding protein